MTGKGSRSLPRLAPDAITTLARDIVTNRVWCAWNERDLRDAFGMILALGAGAITTTKARQIGLVWEYREHAVKGIACNGSPIFFSCHFVHRDDVPAILDELRRMEVALGIDA